jgi:hypothetical protein
MVMGHEPERINDVLTVAREPKGPKRAGDPGSTGDQALMDALIIVLLAWALLFFLAFSLRRHNI